MSIIGQAPHRYDFERDWAKLPRWWNFGETGHAGPPRTSVKGAVAANGDVYVLCRAAHPVLVFDAEGRFQTSWGEGRFSNFVHGLSIDRDGKVWITDTGLHTVTGTAFTNDGSVFVSDGYGNRRVHRFSPGGEHLHAWGEPGTGPGQFALVHFITADAHDRLYVCDRENHRIQIFSMEGEVLAEWTGFHMPSDIVFGKETIYVAGGDGVSLWTYDRRKLAQFGPDMPHKGAFNVHGIWLDAEENIYLAQFDRAVSKLSRR
jgi:hypothetical protein